MNNDKIAEIKERHEFISSRTAAFFFPETAWTAHDDRATLLAEVERLRAENDGLREVIRTIRARCVELDDSDAVSEVLDISSTALGDEP